MRTLAGIGALGRRRDDLAAAAADLDAATMAVVRRAFISGAVMDVVITFAIAVDATYIGLSLLGFVHLHDTPHLTLFAGLLALLLCPMYFAPLRATAAAYHTREKAAAAVPAITGLLADTPLADTEPSPSANKVPAAPVTGPVTVVLEDVSFAFGGRDGPVLDRVSLTAQAGC